MAKTQELKNFSYFGISHKGNIREENEDMYAYFETVNGTFFIVCDGMGGIKGGKEAAETTIKEISSKWGGEQTVTGPIISIPYKSYYKDKEGKVITTIRNAHFLGK